MRPSVSLSFSDGTAITSFLSMTHTERFSDPVDTMSFVVAPPRGSSSQQVQEYAKRLRKGEVVGLKIDEKPQAALMLTQVATTIGPSDGIVFSCTAKSPISLLYESTVPYETEAKALSSDKPILDLVASICEPFGFGEVFADNDVAVIKSKTGRASDATPTPAKGIKYKTAMPQPNETCYAFLNRILCRLGLILRMGSVFGSLYITRPHYEQTALYTFKCGSGGPAVAEVFEGSVTVTESNENQYSFVEATGDKEDSKGSTNSDRPLFRAYSAAISSKRPPFRASELISHKPCFYRDTSCQSKTTAKAVALLVLGERAESAFGVEGSIGNIVSTKGVPFTVDTVARIHIPQVGLDEDMWLSERTISVEPGGGGRTQLRFIPKNYYTIGELPS